MQPPVVIAVLCAVLIALLIAMKPAPRAGSTSPGPARSASTAPAPATALWPLTPDTKWVYSVAKPGAKPEEAVVFATEGRSGVRLVEERGGRSVDVDEIEERADGWYWSEHDTTQHPWKLIPADFPKTRDWEPLAGVRASVVRDTTFPLGDRTLAAHEIQYEQADPKRGGAYVKKMTLTFAPGVGIVAKDSVVDGDPGGERWDLQRFEPAGR